MSTTTLSCGFCGETGHPGEARRPHPHTAQTRGDPPTPSAAHLQAAQGAEAQEVARLLREALAEAGGGALHGAGDLGAADGSAGPRAPQPRAPRHRVQPPTPRAAPRARPAHRAEAPRRRRRGRRPGQAGQRRRVGRRPRLHPPGPRRKAGRRLPRSRTTTPRRRRDDDGRLPASLQSACPERRLTNRVQTLSHVSFSRSLSDVCGRRSGNVSPPSHFRQ